MHIYSYMISKEIKNNISAQPPAPISPSLSTARYITVSSKLSNPPAQAPPPPLKKNNHSPQDLVMRTRVIISSFLASGIRRNVKHVANENKDAFD